MRAHHLAVWLLPFALAAQNVAEFEKEFEKKVTEFTLANGLHFIVAERHEAPVVSFHTYVSAGSVDDPSGETGIAHMFEHMAFKGTERIGSRNWPEEKAAIEHVEAVYDQLDQERDKGAKADAQKIAALEAELMANETKAGSYVIPNLYPRIIEENGGEGMNAETRPDSTEYFYSLPSNRLELWFLLESERFIQPVFREFYKERDVVMEEYRMRVESEPQGMLMQAFLATAFAAFPYRVMGTGWPSDVAHLRRADAWRFFREYYVPGNITLAMAGDVQPEEAKRLAEKYFGAMPARPLPPPLHTTEPPQDGPKRAEIASPSQPLLFVGYKRPDQYSKEDPVFDIISGILSGGRTGILYKELVRDKQIALEAEADDTFPSGRYPNLFLFFIAPAMGHTTAENEKAFYDLIERFKSQKVDAETLARVKTKTRADLIRRLDSNAGLASILAAYYANYGDWRKWFTELEEIERVTADDVQRVAQECFVPEKRTVTYLIPPRQPEGAR
jgi:predicted Zn-dependent peptidase